MYYVSMTDKHLSYWGRAENKINKVVIECNDYDDAVIVHNNAIRQGSMKHINILSDKPYYNPNRYLVNFKELSNPLYNSWHKEGHFKND